MPPTTLIRFVRHGESTWNAEGRIQGQARRVPLTALGQRQAEAAALLLRGCGARRLYCSDLDRAVQSAAPIARELGVPAVPEPALREQALGLLEGRLAAELTAEPAPPGVPVTSVRWGGGESVADVHRRVGAFLRRILAGSAVNLVLVSHADAIRAAIAWLRGLGPHQLDWSAVPNGSVTTVVLEGGLVREVKLTAPGVAPEAVSPGQLAGPPFHPGMVAPGRRPH